MEGGAPRTNTRRPALKAADMQTQARPVAMVQGADGFLFPEARWGQDWRGFLRGAMARVNPARWKRWWNKTCFLSLLLCGIGGMC